ncbi:MAG TPA: hypothetical protein VG013_00970 [Gemmataceae bacterium]|nr:hypothetical protein [Gemmataceae bacterium]
MVIQHVNRRGDTFYLHQGKTKTGKPKFFFSRKQEGTLANAIPAGYEVYENPNAQVFLRKALPLVVTAEEIATVDEGVRKYAKLTYFVIDVKGHSIVIHLANEDVAFLEGSVLNRLGMKSGPGLARELQRFLTYSPMMRFTLVDEAGRQFAAERWCFLGSIDDWFPLSGGGDLGTLVARYCPHLGRESFYELM